ncbi:hypothetical protein CJ030_MR6G007065 [Morella rubra]|uniref:Uncharacterized protein n=1 Tax=Morella rubra TaxID=262757 RepID=A0A6A1V8L9_9ROSI|nr:hypothetical protein CJ030_MR6G007065 [Morella rubra]
MQLIHSVIIMLFLVPAYASPSAFAASTTSQRAAAGDNVAEERRRSVKRALIPFPDLSAPNTREISASTTSRSTFVGHDMDLPPLHSMKRGPVPPSGPNPVTPSQSSMKWGPVPPSAPNPGTNIPASHTSHNPVVSHDLIPSQRPVKHGPVPPFAPNTTPPISASTTSEIDRASPRGF